MQPRPRPPVNLCEEIGPRFNPAPDLAAWIRETFIDELAVLVNVEHSHLQHAVIGVLWTNVPNGRQGRRIIGQCETGAPRGAMGKWPKARAEQQLREWFGDVPDFVLTFDADYGAACSDAEFCALVEHELYHAAPDRDEYGSPKFSKEGKPKFAIRGHDVEEFVGVVRRYGAEATNVQALVEAASKRPEVALARIAMACGTCMLRAA